MQTESKQLCSKRKTEFKDSRTLGRNFKARRGIGLKDLHGEADSAEKQWVSVSRADLECCWMIFPALLPGSDREDV